MKKKKKRMRGKENISTGIFLQTRRNKRADCYKSKFPKHSQFRTQPVKVRINAIQTGTNSFCC